MEYNLAIDRGNTSVKFSVLEGGKVVLTERFERLTAEIVSAYKKRFDIGGVIYSSVAGNDTEEIALLESVFDRCLVLNSSLPMPLSIDYATPHTLGADRMAVAVGALAAYPGRDLLVVDSGTAITLDLVTADGCFRGGNIAPGIATRFASLSEHCARLPLLDAEGDIPLVGYDTATAIRSGVVMGVVAQVRQMYADLKADYPQLLVVLTGGDCHIIAKRLNLEEMEVNENLVTIGLNRILEHNESI